jgi:hypothetical protein
MRAFACQRCHELVHFEDQTCGHCGIETGFNPDRSELETLEETGDALTPYGEPQGRQWARCARAGLIKCNWLVPADQAGQVCASCRLTISEPPIKDDEFGRAFAKAESAKRRLLFELHQLRLPIVSRQENAGGGLAFELLAGDRHVLTGHDNGLITIDLNESDDAFREHTRAQFGEPYRTLLGHFRHEIGHYYWGALLRNAATSSTLGATSTDGEPRRQHDNLLAAARDLFGDDTADYAAALQRHYASGPRSDWGDTYVSAYASVHPLEDWAETFAHYLHIWDAVQTAASFGVLVVGPVDDRTGRRDPAKASVPSEETAALEGFDAVIADWLTLALALNALNRSLGKDDLYPFDLPPAVKAKLAFVHRVITAAAGSGDRAASLPA